MEYSLDFQGGIWSYSSFVADLGQLPQVNVPAADHNSYSLHAARHAAVEHRGGSNCPTRFHDDFQTREEKSYRSFHLVLRDKEDFIGEALHNRKRHLARFLRTQAVGDGGRHRNLKTLVPVKGQGPVVRHFGFNAEDFENGFYAFAGNRDTAQQSSSSERSHNGVKIGHIFEQFQ